ncbi:MAG: hypothetical protein KDC05_00540, partial [Bacteroidales bacterium]|nr:hypothetical protein [Bacteroidales bacterium]
MKRFTLFFPIWILVYTVVQFQFTNQLSAQTSDSRKFVILGPTDSLVNDLAVLRKKPSDDTVCEVVYDLAATSSMNLSVKLYERIQYFLVNTGEQDQTEPAYLLLSQHQGGFPRHGFYLLQGDSLIDKSHVSYVELVKNNPGPEDHLGSMTQMYPHELGHVYYHLLTADSDSAAPGTTDIHYVTLVTDFGTAFNEGFAIHFENMARMFEPDPERKEKVLSDVILKKEKTEKRRGPFRRDFTFPGRIGFYRASMVFWYQDFEDIKRFEWV